jgi:hypothetical protein
MLACTGHGADRLPGASDGVASGLFGSRRERVRGLWLDFSEAGAREAHRPRHAASRVRPRNGGQGWSRTASRELALSHDRRTSAVAVLASAADERLAFSNPGQPEAATVPMALPWLGV